MKKFTLTGVMLALAALPALAEAPENETWTEVGEGVYSDAFMSNMYQSSFDNEPVNVIIEVSDQNPARYRVQYPWPMVDSEENWLIIDASDPDFVLVPKQKSPVEDSADGETWIASISAIAIEDFGYTKEQFLEEMDFYNITMKDGVINFPAGCAMFMWPNAVSGYTDPGKWVVSNDEFSGYLAFPGVEPPSEWHSLGMGRICDGFVHTFLNSTKESVIRDVEVMEHNLYEGYYRIVAPFADDLPEGGDLYIDMYHPDFGLMEIQNIGYTHDVMGQAFILSASANGLFQGLEDFLDKGHIEEENISMEEGLIKIPSKSVLYYFPTYDDSGLFQNRYAVDSYIQLPGATSVKSIARAEDAPAEYYNLLGQRLKAPVSGELVIVREGGKTYKMIAR